MSNTQNYKLFKFEDNNTADLRLQNLSMDIIDSKLYELNNNIVQANNKIDNIKIADASLTQKGIVKLNNTVTSTSNSEASTASAVKQAYDKAVQAFQSASDGKTYITGKLGNTNVNNTFTQIGDEIQNCKNIISNNLVQKGVYANNNFDLRNLAGLVGNISLSSMGGVRFQSGSVSVVPKYFLSEGSSWHIEDGFLETTPFLLTVNFPIKILLVSIVLREGSSSYYYQETYNYYSKIRTHHYSSVSYGSTSSSNNDRAVINSSALNENSYTNVNNSKWFYQYYDDFENGARFAYNDNRYQYSPLNWIAIG